MLAADKLPADTACSSSCTTRSPPGPIPVTSALCGISYERTGGKLEKALVLAMFDFVAQYGGDEDNYGRGTRLVRLKLWPTPADPLLVAVVLTDDKGRPYIASDVRRTHGPPSDFQTDDDGGRPVESVPFLAPWYPPHVAERRPRSSTSTTRRWRRRPRAAHDGVSGWQPDVEVQADVRAAVRAGHRGQGRVRS